MTRAQLLAYLAVEFAALFAETGIEADDTDDGIGFALDQTFRKLGATGDLSAASAADDEVEAAQALGEFYTLRRFLRALGGRSEFDATAVKAGRTQVFTQVSDLLKDAAQRCTALGYAVTTVVDENALMTLQLDYIEPELI